MKHLFITLVFSLSLMISPSVFGWGLLGHRVVGEVASNHLSKKAEKAVQRVLGNKTLAEVSNWMDDVKSDKQPKYDTLNAYHYVSIPDGMKYEDTNLNPKGDAIVGINTAIAKLKSKTLSPEMEEHYLNILIHLVGDLHQPLHVGRVDDRGGNTINVGWFGDKSNLHRVWDSDMLNDKRYSYTELTALVDHATPEEIRIWQASTMDDWVQECQDLRPSIYDFEEKRFWEYKYMYEHWDTVQHQLLKGGIRLAGILNDIYG